MSKTTIFYYTNNLLPPKLLKHSLGKTIELCKNNNCELILTSHYPLLQSYEDVPLDVKIIKPDPLYQHIVKDPLFTNLEVKNIKNYVVGQLPYSHESIIRQILFSISKCSGDNIILMEHDCLYPDNYITTVEKVLNDYGRDMCYCSFNITFLNHNGYFNIENGSFVLSTCSFKKNILQGIYERKLELINSAKPYVFEPLLDVFSQRKKDQYKDEIIVRNHLCIDTFLKDKCPLDIKHHLNTDGMLTGNNYYHAHPYWGKDETYLDMIKIDNVNNLWDYGIGKFNY